MKLIVVYRGSDIPYRRTILKWKDRTRARMTGMARIWVKYAALRVKLSSNAAWMDSPPTVQVPT